MIFTARQLEQLYNASGKVTLPFGARLTPLAMDWIRQHKIEIGYGESDGAEQPKAKRKMPDPEPAQNPHAGRWVWWADGTCGPAKAAIVTLAREAKFQADELPIDQKHIVDAMKRIASEIKNGTALGAFVLVGTGANAMIYANRCPSLRAVLGTCLEAVEQGVRLAAANVLVIEHPYKSLQQTKTLLARFVRGPRELEADVKRDLEELSSCG